MRTKKAAKNGIVSVVCYFIAFIPMFVVRKVFLDRLGNELLGLISLFTNIIGYLSIVEMGVGAAIIFSLYEPFANKEYKKVVGYLKFYKKCYMLIGGIVLCLGIIALPFLGVFINDNINIVDVRLYFILFLINTCISYLFSYKLSILNVAQQGYKVSIATTVSKLIIAMLQIIFLNIYSNLYIYILIQIVINLIYYIAINYYIDKSFNWLKDVNGYIKFNDKNNLSKNIKALFLHKIGGVAVFGTDNIVISSFVNLAAVSRFDSYNMVMMGFESIISSFMNAVTPSIGNLLVEKNDKLSYKVFKRLFFLSFWVVSFITVSLFNTINQFVNIWLGKSQILNLFTVSILMINFYFRLMRIPVDRFKEGAGLYYEDRYAPLFEGIINLITSIILVKIIGLPGVILGTLISNISVVFWVKPKIIYKYIFKISLFEYFKMYFKYCCIALISLSTTFFITNIIKGYNGIIMFIINCLCN
ncbi:lipopolysaccharide biosynthesis protein, partial [Clostridium tarantellae]